MWFRPLTPHLSFKRYMSNRDLTDLRNLGAKVVQMLAEIGICSEDQLRSVGAVEAYRRMKALRPGTTLPLCYYLYSLEGALTDTHWDAIGSTRKQQLKHEATRP